jgi:predicted enzyme related to lactoylglutathione lyase
MASEQVPQIGRVAWVDLTVEHAELVGDFYAQVAGWTPAPVDMGDYADFNMLDADGQPAAGVCHARGVNSDLPPQWLMYITVADLDAALETCVGAGGEVVGGTRGLGALGRFAVIRDPAGAVAALYQAPPGAGS